MAEFAPINGVIDLIGKHDLVVELGVFKGSSLDALLSSTEFSGEYIGIDLWQFDKEIYSGDVNGMRALIDAGGKDAEILCRIKEEKYKNCTLIKENTHTACRHFSDNSVDFLFIDACHDFSSVVNDIEGWYDKVKFGGYLAGDDYYCPGVKRAVDVCLRKKRKAKVTTRYKRTKGDRYWFSQKRRP